MTQHNATDFFLPADLVARALASLAEQCHDEIDRLSVQPEQGDPSVKEELKFRLRDYEAYIKAGFQWGKGVRPVLTPLGTWLVPSRTTGGLIHEVRRADGFWMCGPTCKCPVFHWHTALVRAIEYAQELADQEDGDTDACPICDGAGCAVCDGSELTEDEIAEQTNEFAVWDAAQQFGARLARARAAAMELY